MAFNYRIYAVLLSVVALRAAGSNPRPVVGILSLDYYGNVENKTSYIAASYVKWVEAAGARVIPIMLNQSSEYYDEILESVNGVLFPGGAVYVEKETGYSTTGQLIYKKILDINRRSYLPLWGTCLGMELALYSHLNQTDPRTKCSSQDVALPLQFTSTKGRMFKYASYSILRTLRTRAVTINYHSRCVTPENFNKTQLHNDFQILAVNQDIHGTEFISILEHKTLPIYLVQFHPEKNQFEWINNAKHHNIPHSSLAVRIGQYFADFFVNECRRNSVNFPKNRNNELIYHYPITYTGNNSVFVQSYLFDDESVQHAVRRN